MEIVHSLRLKTIDFIHGCLGVMQAACSAICGILNKTECLDGVDVEPRFQVLPRSKSFQTPLKKSYQPDG